MARQKGSMHPIRSQQKIQEMLNWLKHNKHPKYYMMFKLGINTGLRVSDLLNLKVSDIKGKDCLRIVMQKTGDLVVIPLNSKIMEEIEEFIYLKQEHHYLFPSRVGVNRKMNRQYVSEVLKEASAECGLEFINTHTMRKTYGYWQYKQFKDVNRLMILFGHKKPEITLKYIGVFEDDLMKTKEEFYL